MAGTSKSRRKPAGGARRERKPPAENGSVRQAELLAIAARLFAERGYTATTVRDIADAAGMLSGSLYHHFDSKESMIDAILSDFLDALLERYREIVDADMPPQQALEELIDASLQAVNTHRDAIVIYQNEGTFLSQIPRMAYVGDAAKRFEQVWVRTLRRGFESGDFREGFDAKLVYRFIRDSLWTAGRWYRRGGGLSIPKIAEQYERLLMGGLSTAPARDDD